LVNNREQFSRNYNSSSALKKSGLRTPNLPTKLQWVREESVLLPIEGPESIQNTTAARRFQGAKSHDSKKEIVFGANEFVGFNEHRSPFGVREMDERDLERDSASRNPVSSRKRKGIMV